MRDKVRLQHILEAINYIEEFIQDKSEDDLNSNAMLRFAIERQLEIIGEASNHISVDLLALQPQINWRAIKGFRNILAHEYFQVATYLVWNVITTNLPDLKNAVIQILATLLEDDG